MAEINNESPLSLNNRTGRRTVTSASSRLRRSRKDHERDQYNSRVSRTKEPEFHDVTDEDLRDLESDSAMDKRYNEHQVKDLYVSPSLYRKAMESRCFLTTPFLTTEDTLLLISEKRKQKLERPKVMQKMYENACHKYKVVPVRQYWEVPDTHILCLPNYNLGPLGVQALAVPIMLHESITKLDLSGNDMGPSGARALVEALTGNTSLTELDLSDNKLQTEGAMALKSFIREHPFLHTLLLSGNGFRDTDSIIFGQVMKENQRLKHVNFSHNEFAETAGLEFRYVMSDTENLESFDISWNYLRRKGAMDLLAGVKKNFGLKSLNVSFNGFATEGAAVLANVLKKNRTLQEVDISHNRLTDKDVINIANKMDCNDALRILRLGDNHITMNSVLPLLSVLLNPENVVAMELLDLGNTCVDEEFDFIATELMKSRPNLQILYGRILKKKRIIPKNVIPLTNENGGPYTLPPATDDDDLVFSEGEKTKSMMDVIGESERKDNEKNNMDNNSKSKTEESSDKPSDEISPPLKQSSENKDSNDSQTNNNEKADQKSLKSEKTRSSAPMDLFVLQRESFIEK